MCKACCADEKRMNVKKSVPYVTLGMIVVYFLSVIVSAAGLFITGNSFTPAVIALELSTVSSAPLLLLLFEIIPVGRTINQENAKKFSLIFMACCMVLTSVVHFAQLTVTQPLIASGVQVPIFLRVGFWPSIPMAIDYLAWGFFMGTALLCSSFAARKDLKFLKNTLRISALLCYAGLLGVALIHANYWYLAPCGYGVGTIFICMGLILENKRKTC